MAKEFLMSKTVFVFGSNTGGFHGKGAALTAKRDFGAIEGIGEGLMGNSYALPTVCYKKGMGLVTMGLTEIKFHINNFINFAKNNPDIYFQLTKVGCGLAGYSEDEILPFFLGRKDLPENIIFPYDWERKRNPELKKRVIVAGSRDFDNYDLLCEKLDFYLANKKVFEIISGGAKGADSLGERYAREKGIDLTIINADWDDYKRKAGYIRNEKMAWYSSHLIAFWDGQSRGTKSMIELGQKYNLITKVFNYNLESYGVF